MTAGRTPRALALRHRLQRLAAAGTLALAGGAVSAAIAPLPAEVQTLIKAGKPAEALRRIDSLLAKAPADPALQFHKGVLLVEQKRINEAITVFERLGKEHPHLPEPLNNLAVLYVEKNQMEKARSALEAAVRSQPSYETAYQNLSSVNIRIASRAYSKALQIDDSEGMPRLSFIKNLYDPADPASERTIVIASNERPAAKPAAPASPAAASGNTPATAPAIAAAKPAPTTGPSPAAASVAAAAATPKPTEPPPAKPGDKPAGKPADKPSDKVPAKPAIELPKMPPLAEPNATASASQRRTTEDAREVNAAVRAWASAWSRKDLPDYYAAYLPDFRGGENSANAWREVRRQRIVSKSKISVELSGLTVQIGQGNTATASFRQTYSADTLNQSAQKTLELVKRDGKWLIRKESVGS